MPRTIEAAEARGRATAGAMVRLHARRTPSAGHLRRDVSEMQRLAAHVHDQLHHGGNRFHLRRDLAELDRLQHHVEDVLAGMLARRELPPAGAEHIRESLARTGRTIHRMQAECR